MSKLKFHKVAAVAVLIGFAAWMGTGEFSSVGSAAPDGVDASPSEARPAPTAETAAKAPRTVAVVVPPRVQHERAIHLSGQTQADKRAVLATRAAGIIEDLPVRQGEKVEAGQVILALSAEDKPAMIETATQLVRQRQAELEAAQRLAKSGTLAKLSLDNAVSALAAAESQLKAAQSDLERMTVVAPFSGIIDSVDVELGSAVSQGAQIATLLSLDPVVVKGEVSERDLAYIKSGDKAEARLVDGKAVTGTVRYISREAAPATRTFRVEVAIPNPGDSIPAGMTAEITVRAAPSDAVILPRSVVTLSANGDLGIRAVDKDNKVVFYPIDLMDDLSNGFVLGGVPREARIIVAGQDLVTEGDVVNPVPADEQLIKKLVGEVAASN